MKKIELAIQAILDKPFATNKEIADEVGCTVRTVRSARQAVDTAPKKNTSVENAIKAGLHKKGLSSKNKAILAQLVAEMETVIDRQPTIDLIKNERKTKDSAVLMISDLHAGSKVIGLDGKVSFDKDILAQRMDQLTKQTIKILKKHIRLENIDQLHMAVIGDVVDGAGIYAGQELHQDIHNPFDQAPYVAALLWNMAKQFKKQGIKVSMKCTAGNHGRTYKYAPADQNFDLLVYQLLYMYSQYEDTDIVVDYSTIDGYAFDCKGHRILMKHIGPKTIESPAGKAKFMSWAQLFGDADIILTGHLHHAQIGSHLDLEHIMNGSLVGHNDLSQRMGVGADPMQILFGMNEKYGRTFTYHVKPTGKSKSSHAKVVSKAKGIKKC